MDKPNLSGPAYGMLTDPSNDLVKEIHQARKMGFDYVELNAEIPGGHYRTLRDRKQEILKALKPFQKPPICHTAYWVDLWTDYEEVRQAWLQVLRKNIDASHALGCRKMNIHAPIIMGMYKYSKPENNRALDNCARSLREIVRYAKKHDMMIVLENMPDPETMTLKEFSCIVDKVPGMCVHLDIGHAFLEGGMKGVRKYFRTFKSRIEHIHASDNLGLVDDHVGIGQGIIDYIGVFEILKKSGYDKTITLEIFSGRKDLRNSLRLMKAISEEVWPR